MTLSFDKINEGRRRAAAVHAATGKDRDQVLLSYPALAERLTTAAEYHVCHQETNAASAQVDKDREPFLINLEALEFGLHPFVEVYGPMIETQKVSNGKRSEEYIVLDLHAGIVIVPPDTLIAWR